MTMFMTVLRSERGGLTIRKVVDVGPGVVRYWKPEGALQAATQPLVSLYIDNNANVCLTWGGKPVQKKGLKGERWLAEPSDP